MSQELMGTLEVCLSPLVMLNGSGNKCQEEGRLESPRVKKEEFGNLG